MFHVLVDGETITYPVTVTDFRAAHPNVSMRANPAPDALADYGMFPVTPTTPPEHDPDTEDLTRSAELVDGAWVEVWTVTAAPDAAARIAAKRERIQAPTSAFMEAMLDADLYGAAETALTSIADVTERRRLQIQWQHAPIIARTSPLMLTLQTALELTDAEVDALFAAAVP